MRKIIFFIVIVFLAVNALPSFADEPKIMMSYWGYSNVENKDFQNKINLLNVIAYAFLHVNQKGIAYFNRGNFNTFLQFQNRLHNLKRLISIGGAGDEQSLYNALNNPVAFVDSVTTIINQYHLSGVDLDFETQALFTPQQAEQFAALIQLLRQKLGASFIISMAVPSDEETLHSIGRKNWAIIISNINFISVMCYDFHTSSFTPNYTGYNSNLYSDPNEPMINKFYHISCDQSIKYLTFLGVPPQKIVMGFPSYGLSFGGVKSESNGLFQSFIPRLTPSFDEKGAGRVEYSTILKLLGKGFKEHTFFLNGHISGVWAYNFKTKQFISYDNVALVKEKANFINKNHLAGAMTWMVNYDTSVENNNSLLKTMVRNLH